jgi:cleavage and polyadenylation specificity factor subunit 1
MHTYATEFLIDKHSLSLVASDERKNIQLFGYAPQSIESRGGQTLTSRGDFHLGALINNFIRLPMQLSTTSKNIFRQAAWFGKLANAAGEA